VVYPFLFYAFVALIEHCRGTPQVWFV
jgi:hypothetical protein